MSQQETLSALEKVDGAKGIRYRTRALSRATLLNSEVRCGRAGRRKAGRALLLTLLAIEDDLRWQSG